MKESTDELTDTLYTLASSELLLSKGVLSCIRLLTNDLEKGVVENSDSLYEKQKAYMDEIDKVQREYNCALGKIENQTLKAALSLYTFSFSTEFPEFSQVFSVLSELRETVDEITELNKYAIDQTNKLSLECMEKIKSLQKQRTLSSNFQKHQDLKAGSLFNYTEK